MVKKCENCGREIQDNRNYEAHVQRCVFNRTKTLTCDKCNRKYSYRSSMYLHRRSCNGIKEDNYDEYDDVCSTKSKKIKSSINKRSRNRTSYAHQDVAVNLLKPDNNYKYVMCLRTKTCHRVKADGNDVQIEENGIQSDTDDITFIEDSQEAEVNEIIIEELPEENDENPEREPIDQAVVVLEDFGFFNKVELRNVEESDENVEEIEENC